MKGLCFEQIIAVGFFIVALFVTVGGLGGTFYVAYLSNAALFTIAVVFVINVFFFQEDLLGMPIINFPVGYGHLQNLGNTFDCRNTQRHV